MSARRASILVTSVSVTWYVPRRDLAPATPETTLVVGSRWSLSSRSALIGATPSC